MMPTMMEALTSALSATAESDPRSMSREELGILDRLDDQIGEMLDALMDGGECRSEMQAVLAKAMRST
jgi:hypothetical protein